VREGGCGHVLGRLVDHDAEGAQSEVMKDPQMGTVDRAPLRWGKVEFRKRAAATDQVRGLELHAHRYAVGRTNTSPEGDQSVKGRPPVDVIEDNASQPIAARGPSFRDIACVTGLVNVGDQHGPASCRTPSPQTGPKPESVEGVAALYGV
jgi:hypothetical protein